MTDTLIKGGLGTIHPKSVWVSKERTSACISDNGVVACIFHGNQAVSRNSYIMKGTVDEPALKFCFKNSGDIVSYIVDNCRYSINECSMMISVVGSLIEINVLIKNDSINIIVQPSEENPNLTFDVTLNEKKLAKDVYGNRKWSVETNGGNRLARLVSDDRTKISEWVSRHSAFLIPLEIQNKIFVKDPLSDITFSDAGPEIKSEYQDGLFIDERIYTDIYGQGFTKSFSGGECLVFSSDISSCCHRELVVRFSSSSEDKVTKADTSYSKPEIPLLIYPADRGLEELFSFIPGVIESVIQHDTGMPRACAGGYYWIWGWDTIVAALEFSKWGRIDRQKQIIAFLLNHRWKNGTIPHRFDRTYEAINVKPGVTDALFIILVKQYLEESSEYKWLGEIYTTIKEIWNGILEYTDEDGFIFGLGTYPDNPKAMGRTPQSRVAIDSGAFYSALVCMLGFAEYMDDKETSSMCRSCLEDYSEKYISAFFDKGKQMIFDSFTPDKNSFTYPVYSLLSLNNRAGIPLLLNKQKVIAEFVSREYFTEHGFRALPVQDSNKDTECIHHSWFLYWDVCIMSLMRTFGYYEILKTYQDNIGLMWKNYRTLFEFIDLDNIKADDERFPWSNYGCSWPIHGSVSVYRNILEALLGLRLDMGCITILDGPVSDGTELKGLNVSGKKWDFKFRGTGNYIKEIKVNGNILAGSMVIPDSIMTEHNDIEIHHGFKRCTSLAVMDVFGGRIIRVRSKDTGLDITVKSDGFTTLLIRSDRKPVAKCNGEAVMVNKIEGQPEVYYIRSYSNDMDISFMIFKEEL